MTAARPDERVALVVVDVQRAFTDPDGALAVEGGADVVTAVNAWVHRAVDRGWPVLYTRDVEPVQLPEGDPDGQTALAEGLVVDGVVVPKGPGRRGGMSGFVLLSGATGGLSDLAGHLGAAAVEHVVVVGLAADVCVAATARDAARLGHRVTVPLSATAFVHADPRGDSAVLDDLRAAGITVLDVGPQPVRGHPAVPPGGSTADNSVTG